MRQVTVAEILNWGPEDIADLSYFDLMTIVRVWQENQRISGVPEHIAEKYGFNDYEGFMRACQEYGAHYYARDNEDFSIIEAVEEAVKAGKQLVWVENLS